MYEAEEREIVDTALKLFREAEKDPKLYKRVINGLQGFLAGLQIGIDSQLNNNETAANGAA